MFCRIFFSPLENPNLNKISYGILENMSTKKSLKISNRVDQELYGKVSINNLILFGIYLLTENEKKCTFERLLKKCFNLFPKTFGFREFTKWPDSRKLDRPLRTLRRKKLIIGNPKIFFKLTNLGRKIAKETAETFRQEKLGL